MDKKHLFDISIKNMFLNGECYLPGLVVDGEADFGRVIKEKFHETYFSIAFGNKFKTCLADRIVKAYKNGKGNELNTDKFYSVASSSRFAVASFTKNRGGRLDYISDFEGESVQEIQFEKGLKIEGIKGTPPQMDVYVKTNKESFVEVKCHEIFDESAHAIIKLSSQYLNNAFFSEIMEHYGINKESIEYDLDENGNSKNLLLNRKLFNIFSKTTRFDLKQFLCHLMGIISQTKMTDKKQFIYLFYKSTDTSFNYVYDELNDEIELLQNSFGWLFEKYNITFRVLYNTKFDTLD